MKSFTFRLPVKKYIQKYLTTLHGETIAAEMETDIGFVVLNTLASRLESQVARGYNKVFDNTYLAEITFTIPFHYFYLTRKQISISTCILLNRYFEKKFEQEFMQFIEMNDISGRGKYKKAIEAFAKKYNIVIEEDISFFGLQKMEYRARKKNFEKSLCGLSTKPDLFRIAVA